MRLVDLIQKETGVDFEQIALVRHFNKIDRLVELGGTVEEFTSVQPKGKKWDFWADGRPQIDVVAVIVHDRVFGIYRVLGVEAEGPLQALSTDALRRFDAERGLYANDRPTRRFAMAKIPCWATNAEIRGWAGKAISPVLRSNSDLFYEIELLTEGATLRLADEEALDNDAGTIESYCPQDGDFRQIIDRQIRERRGQKEFRNALRNRYGDQCLITGCRVLAVLEAAHIKPYRGENDNDPGNGLLLRADIHTLFDLNFVAIQPDSLQVELHPRLARNSTYREFCGKTLHCARKLRPSRKALGIRYECFQESVRSGQGLQE